MKIKKNGKVIRLTESDLKKIVKRVLTEQTKPIGKALEDAALSQILRNTIKDLTVPQTYQEKIETVEKAIESLKAESLRIQMERKKEMNSNEESGIESINFDIDDDF